MSIPSALEDQQQIFTQIFGEFSILKFLLVCVGLMAGLLAIIWINVKARGESNEIGITASMDMLLGSVFVLGFFTAPVGIWYMCKSVITSLTASSSE